MTEAQVSLAALRKAFPGIADEEANRLIDSGQVARYDSGTVLCLEDAIEDKFYVLLEGEVKVSKMINEGEDRLLKVLNPGDFFGEMAIIHNAPRAATVTSLAHVSVLEIERAAFESVLNQSSSVSMAMVREVSRRLRENDEMAIEDLRLKAGELARAYQQLAEQELARRQFLTTIAHELRTPLTSAAGFMKMIQMGAVNGDTMQTAIGTVSRNIEQIVSLINDILFLQEMELILADFKPVDVAAALQMAVESQRKFAHERGVTVRVSAAPDLPNVPGDAKSLERAFAAILNNAIKFNRQGGQVEVAVDHNPAYVWVSVRDQGIGIPPEEMERIFDRFYRIEEYHGMLYGGVGLGLSIAKQVIEQHGGQIEVQSEVDKGSKFTARLKIKPEHRALV